MASAFFMNMNLEILKKIEPNSLEKALQIVAILGDSQICAAPIVTLERAVSEYISYAEHNRASKTLEGVKLVGRYLLKFFAANRDLGTIQLRDCECFLDEVKKNAPKGVYNYLRVLRTMWNKLKKWNYVTANPWEQVELPKRQSMSPAYLTEEMLEKVIAFIDKEVIRDMVVVTFYSGLRRGEVVNIRWGDVDLEKGLLTIGSESFKTKTRKQRVIPMHPKVKEILMKQLKIKNEKLKMREGEESNVGVVQLQYKNRYVFCKSSGYCFTADYLSKQFKKACRRGGIDERIHFHSIRHGSITRMIVNGANLPTVQRIAGHANIQTTMAYTHVGLDEMREAVGRL